MFGGPGSEGHGRCWGAGSGSHAPGKLSTKGQSSQQWLVEGATGLLDPTSKKNLLHQCKMGLRRCKRGFCEVRKTFRRPVLSVQKTICTLLPYQLLESVPCWGQFSRSTASSIYIYTYIIRLRQIIRAPQAQIQPNGVNSSPRCPTQRSEHSYF